MVFPAETFPGIFHFSFLLGVPGIAITPHCAWAARECRAKLIRICAQNLKAYQQGKPIHVVKPEE